MLRDINSKSRRTIRLVALAFLLASVFPASAATLQDLRASGALGESASGYAVARDPSAKSDVAAINKKRKAVYAEKAAAQGVSIDQVGKVYAKEIFKNVPSGTWIQNPQGGWAQK